MLKNEKGEASYISVFIYILVAVILTARQVIQMYFLWGVVNSGLSAPNSRWIMLRISW